MTDVLTAIDDALDTGVAADEDPLTRATGAGADPAGGCAPAHGRVQRAHGQARRRRLPEADVEGEAGLAAPLLQPAVALGMTGAAVLVIAVAAGGLRARTTPTSSAVEEAGRREQRRLRGRRRRRRRFRRGRGRPPMASRSRRHGVRDDLAGGVAVLPPSGRGFAPGRSDRKIERSVALELETPVDQMARVAEQVTAVRPTATAASCSAPRCRPARTARAATSTCASRPPGCARLRDLAALAEVRTQSQTGRDVTREHVTAKDRLRAARAERRSLLRRLEVAATDEEAEAIRRRLDLVAGEINGLRASFGTCGCAPTTPS